MVVENPKYFYSPGKLLLTGEYVVLDGAKSLAIPTSFGQTLKITSIPEQVLRWQSVDVNNNIWFQADFILDTTSKVVTNSTLEVAQRLTQILQVVCDLNDGFKDNFKGILAITELEFPNNWGLGSSSTLINNLANWAQVDAFKLLKQTFGGSGYDIACAQHRAPILYQLNEGLNISTEVSFKPSFHKELFFVHLNKKQNSRDSIKHYRSVPKDTLRNVLSKISKLTERVLTANSVQEFSDTLNKHETIISQLIKTPTIKEQLFSDYPKTIKSLGGWGGDFVLVVGNPEDKIYFKEKGYHTILSFAEMIA